MGENRTHASCLDGQDALKFLMVVVEIAKGVTKFPW